MSFEALLDDTIYKYTLVSSQNDLGEWVVSTSALSDGISARVMPLSEEERMTYAGRFPNVSLKIYVDYDTDISRGDRIQFQDRVYYVNEVLWDSEKTYKKLIVSLYDQD